MATNEHVTPPPPPSPQKRISPLEYRNTDLVSRLLAATPPYLYNMSMPNTYFFSEMLRSFVQAKTERSNANSSIIGRRPRKRSWPQGHKIPSDNTSSQTSSKKLSIEENTSMNNTCFYDPPEHQKLLTNHFSPTSDMNSHSGSHPQVLPTQTSIPPTPNEQSGLILPPPPPIWYPPLQHPHYNTPYGIDPLHFFIDLRVSGHIYDRKKAEKSDEVLGNAPGMTMSKTGVLKTSKHASAFSVPTKSHNLNLNPINLSKIDTKEHKPLKFDVKSLGLDGHNKTGINYVMNNIERVYKDLQEWTGNDHQEYKEYDCQQDQGNEDGSKKELKDLIGLELAVDYMNQNNKMEMKHGDQSESERDGLVEVVDVQDDSENLET